MVRENIHKHFKNLASHKVTTFMMITIILVLFVTIMILRYTSKQEESSANNLLTNQSWQGFAGGTITSQGIRIQPLDRVITHQDGSLGQPNPPVNLAGSHLSVSGDFTITARMEDITTQGSLRLYGKPPLVYDQWRLETGSLDIAVSPQGVAIRIWDGSSSNSNDMRVYPLSLKKTVVISIEHTGDTFVISADNQELGTIPDHHILDSQEVWFGADATIGNDWLLSALTVEPINNGYVEVVPPPSFTARYTDPNALCNLASTQTHNINIGSAIAYETLVTNDKYRDVALRELSMITPENGMKPQFIHPQKNVYAFTEMDTLVAIALKNNILVHGHALVYAKSDPLWISQAPTEDLQNILIDHITTVAGHFKGKVAEWDVVNEPLSNDRAPYHDEQQGLDSNIWYNAMGEQYIDVAFNVAHEADPSAKLYLNDYGLERDGERWDALLALIGRLQDRGVPIDGIGFESHVYGDGDYINPAVLSAHMQTLAKLGLKTRISEIDVTGDDPQEQIDQYRNTLDVCLKALNCTSYSTWGITDLYGSTTRSDRYPVTYGTSLLFDTAFKAKPAYSALQQRLRQP